MFISRLWGENITELAEFKIGLNVILSDGHSKGKSTLVALIDHMLFGNTLKNNNLANELEGNVYIEFSDFKQKYFIFKRNMNENSTSYLTFDKKLKKELIESSEFINKGIKDIRKFAQEYFLLLDDSRGVYRYNLRFDKDYTYSSILFPNPKGPTNSNDSLLLKLLGYEQILDDYKLKKKKEIEKTSISQTINMLKEKNENLVMYNPEEVNGSVKILEEIRSLNSQKYILKSRLKSLKNMAKPLKKSDISNLNDFYKEIMNSFGVAILEDFNHLIKFNEELSDEIQRKMDNIENEFKNEIKKIESRNKSLNKDLKTANNKLSEFKDEMEVELKGIIGRIRSIEDTLDKSEIEKQINQLNEYFENLIFEFSINFNQNDNVEFGLVFKKDNNIVHEIEGETNAKLFSMIFSYSLIKKCSKLPNFLVFDSVESSLNETIESKTKLKDYINMCKKDKDVQLITTFQNDSWKEMNIENANIIALLSPSNYLLNKDF